MSRIRENKETFQWMRVTAILLAGLVAGCACHAQPPSADPRRPLPREERPLPLPSPKDSKITLLEAEVTATVPEFDGDSFSAVLPVRLQEGDMPARLVLEQIAPVLRASGFQRSLAELQVPAEPLRLPPPNVAALAGEVCREAALQDPVSREVCAALRTGKPSAAADAHSRAAYGVTIAQFRSELEKPVDQYSFPQLVDGVPIESAGAYAYRRQGESLSIVHGTLFNRYEVVNRPSVVVSVVKAALLVLGGLWKVGPLELAEPAEMVMLAHGTRRSETGGEVTALRHAWRALVRSTLTRKAWMVWIDAETGALLRSTAQQDGATRQAQGPRWRRDPGLCDLGPCVETVSFGVNDPGTGKFVLALDGLFRRFDRHGDGAFDDGEVTVTGTADFMQVAGNAAKAVCEAGGNTAFRQVHAYAHLYSFHQQLKDAGSMPPFPDPAKPITVWIDDLPKAGKEDPAKPVNWAGYDAYGAGRSLLRFTRGPGIEHAGCPDAPKLRLNGAHDAATLAHEMSHLAVKRIQERRPQGWCQPPHGASTACPRPEGRGLFHDFADAMANAYTSTNCFSGWADKNQDGKDVNRYCKDPARTSEAGGFPRLAHVADAFDPQNPGDHFPERASETSDYANGQIAAAALWRVRQGMRSKSPALGTAEYLVRLNRALWSFGFVKPVCSKMEKDGGHAANEIQKACVLDLYRYLQDLERRMLDAWAAAPPPGQPDWRHTANKVLSGFARGGIYLASGDAVIDVDDQESGDDPEVDGVRHVEVDYVLRGGAAPIFRVWTGPRFAIEGTGAGTVISTAKRSCHTRYQVEVATTATFSPNSKVWKSQVLNAPDCAGKVGPTDQEWNSLLAGTSGDQNVYYRVRTWDGNGANPRISTSPGAGSFNVPPPFVVVNDTGKP